jgi:hypothetical protein
MPRTDQEVMQLLARVFSSKPDAQTLDGIDQRVLEGRYLGTRRRALPAEALSRRRPFVWPVAGVIATISAAVAVAFAGGYLTPPTVVVRDLGRAELDDSPLEAARFIGNKLIVIGTIAGTHAAQWAPSGEYIYTPTIVSVETVLRGTYHSSALTVQSPGGRVGPIEMRFSDATDLRLLDAGTRVLLFLSGDGSASIAPPEPNMAYVVESGVATSLSANRHEIELSEFTRLINEYADAAAS